MRKQNIVASCVAFTIALTNVAAQTFADSGDYEFIGCYNDKLERAIPNIYSAVGTVDQCRKVAEDNGYDLFALQGLGYCFVGHKNATYNRYGFGPSSECWSSLGGTWTNQVYRKKSVAPSPSPSSWEYKGCFKESQNRTMQNLLGQVSAVEQCKQMAVAKGFNTFGLQYFGQCWAGSFSKYDLFGKETNCGTLGSAWSNQVYVKPYTYKGCFEDSLLRTIPNLLGHKYTVATCKLDAFSKGYDTFGVQNGGECYAGTNPNYARVGSQTDVLQCGTNGGKWTNQVYSLN